MSGYPRLLNSANHLIVALIVRADSVTPNGDAFCAEVNRLPVLCYTFHSRW